MAAERDMYADDNMAGELTYLSQSLSYTHLTDVYKGASDGSNYRDISYLNALCLHQIYSLGSGNRQLYQNADRSRGILVGSLRGLGLLSSSRWGTTADDDHDTTNNTSAPTGSKPQSEHLNGPPGSPASKNAEPPGPHSSTTAASVP